MDQSPNVLDELLAVAEKRPTRATQANTKAAQMALAKAVWAMDAKAVAECLEFGTDPNFYVRRKSEVESPLGYSLMSSWEPGAEMLLEAGALDSSMERATSPDSAGSLSHALGSGLDEMSLRLWDLEDGWVREEAKRNLSGFANKAGAAILANSKVGDEKAERKSIRAWFGRDGLKVMERFLEPLLSARKDLFKGEESLLWEAALAIDSLAVCRLLATSGIDPKRWSFAISSVDFGYGSVPDCFTRTNRQTSYAAQAGGGPVQAAKTIVGVVIKSNAPSEMAPAVVFALVHGSARVANWLSKSKRLSDEAKAWRWTPSVVSSLAGTGRIQCALALGFAMDHKDLAGRGALHRMLDSYTLQRKAFSMVLERHPDLMDSKDANGMTPLAWGARLPKEDLAFVESEVLRVFANKAAPLQGGRKERGKAGGPSV